MLECVFRLPFGLPFQGSLKLLQKAMRQPEIPHSAAMARRQLVDATWLY